MNVGKHNNRHPHLSEMRVRVNRRLHPNMTTDRLKEIVNEVLDGIPAPEGIEVTEYKYGQTVAAKDGLSMLNRGDFAFINEESGFNIKVRRVKKQ